MAAKKSLMDTMKSFDTSAPAASSATMEPPVPAPSATPNKGTPSSRQGKRAVTGYVSQRAFTQLQILRAERDMEVQEILIEALNDVFRKYGKPPIA